MPYCRKCGKEISERQNEHFNGFCENCQEDLPERDYIKEIDNMKIEVLRDFLLPACPLIGFAICMMGFTVTFVAAVRDLAEMGVLLLILGVLIIVIGLIFRIFRKPTSKPHLRLMRMDMKRQTKVNGVMLIILGIGFFVAIFVIPHRSDESLKFGAVIYWMMTGASREIFYFVVIASLLMESGPNIETGLIIMGTITLSLGISYLIINKFENP